MYVVLTKRGKENKKQIGVQLWPHAQLNLCFNGKHYARQGNVDIRINYRADKLQYKFFSK